MIRIVNVKGGDICLPAGRQQQFTAAMLLITKKLIYKSDDDCEYAAKK